MKTISDRFILLRAGNTVQVRDPDNEGFENEMAADLFECDLAFAGLPAQTFVEIRASGIVRWLNVASLEEEEAVARCYFRWAMKLLDGPGYVV